MMRLVQGRLRRGGRRPPERGSIALALLASIVVAGLVTVVVAATIAGQRATRFNQEYTGALHVAEAGVQEALHQLNTGQLDPGDSPRTATGTIDGQSFEWTAERTTDQEWTVTSEGTDVEGTTRTVQVTIADEPLFNVAAFSDQLLTFRGANNADSYTSDDSVSASDAWCTGRGRVGSNDTLEFKGKSQGQATCDYYDANGNLVDGATVDGIDLHNWEDDPDAGRCDHGGGSSTNCVDGAGEPWYESDSPDRWINHDDPLEFDEEVAWIEEAFAACQADGSNYEAQFLTSEHAPLQPATSGPTLPDTDTHYYCADSLFFDDDTSLQNASGEDPVVFIVGDEIEVDGSGGGNGNGGNDGRAVNVNCDGCVTSGTFDPESAGVRPEAGALQIYTASEQGSSGGSADVVRVRNHSNVAAAVYAPQASCGGVHGSNAQVHMFGSLVCRDLRNQGGWQFHFDEALYDVRRTDDFSVQRWSEQ